MNIEQQIRHLIRDEVHVAVQRVVERFQPPQSRALPPEESSARLLTTDEVAGRLRMKPATVRRMAERGEIRHTRIGRKYLISPDELSRLLDPDARTTADKNEIDDNEIKARAEQILTASGGKQGKRG